MSQRWGFDLDMSAVRLMHRDAGAWRVIATEPLEGSDIEDRIRAMVEQIDRDEPIELFLPKEQILYLDVKVSSADTITSEIGQALDGRTPYALAELEFDWERISADEVRVAAIARDTLDEATAFAEARGLTVGGFSSLADPEDFPRNPDFGGAPGLLTPAPATQAMADVEELAAPEPPMEETPSSRDSDVLEEAIEEAVDAGENVIETQVADIPAEPAPFEDASPSEPEQLPEPDLEEPVFEASVAASLYESKSEAERPVLDDIPEPELLRMPDENLDALDVEEEIEEEVPTLRQPEKVTARVADTDGPVLQVDDAVPVMQFRSRQSERLTLGDAIEPIPGPPRVRTDIAAGTVSGPAASLRPSTRPTSRPRPARPMRTRNTKRSMFVIALAALLTIGIAAIVWAILPLGPDRTGQFSGGEVIEDSAVAEMAAPVTAETAAAPETVIEVVEAPTVVPPSNDAPNAQTNVSVASAAQIGSAPSLPQPSTGKPASPPEISRLARLSPDKTPSRLPAALPPQRSTVDASVDAPVGSTAPSAEPSQAPTGIAAEPDGPRILKPVKPLPLNGTFQSWIPEVGPSPAPYDDTVEPVEIQQAALQPDSLPDAQVTSDRNEPDAERATALPTPSALAASLPSTPPRARALTEDVAEVAEEETPVEDVLFVTSATARVALEGARPPARPGVETVSTIATVDNALQASPLPRARPVEAALVASVDTSQAIAAAYDYQVPDTSSAIIAALTPEVAPAPRRSESAAVAPRPQDTPALVTMPSKASVAGQATQKDAIKLGRLNLVGVFGQPSDRRALLRLPSGKIVRVKVGDRLDGGTVAQIGDGELRYRKGGRTLALKMPQG